MHVRVHIYMHTQRPEEDVSCLSLQLCLIESGLLTELEAHRFVSAGWPVIFLSPGTGVVGEYADIDSWVFT